MNKPGPESRLSGLDIGMMLNDSKKIEKCICCIVQPAPSTRPDSLPLWQPAAQCQAPKSIVLLSVSELIKEYTTDKYLKKFSVLIIDQNELPSEIPEQLYELVFSARASNPELGLIATCYDKVLCQQYPHSFFMDFSTAPLPRGRVLQMAETPNNYTNYESSCS